MKAPTRRRRLQFTLRTLLAFFVVAALLLGYLATAWRAHLSKVALIREIDARGGVVLTEARGPSWLRRIGAYHRFDIPQNPPIGVFDPVIKVCLDEPEFSDGFLARLDAFPNLRSLDLSHSGVTNDGLRHLGKLPSLREICLRNTAVTDDGMPYLGKLNSLTKLDLAHVRVCGRGFHRLHPLRNLKVVLLTYSPVRDEAMEQLKAIPTVRYISVHSCRHLSRQAVAEFQVARPDCELFGLYTLE